MTTIVSVKHFKISLNPEISSSNKLLSITYKQGQIKKCITTSIYFKIKKLISALTLRAIFFSLFIVENCFNRLRIAESRGLSGATPSTQTQG
jgi:hypothetical protein